jgi:hypothetical protein
MGFLDREVEVRHFDIVPNNLFLASGRRLILSFWAKGERKIQTSEVRFHIHLEAFDITHFIASYQA